jgi:D-amino-acid dehydrogenase
MSPRRIIIVGGGVVGIATAALLAEAGHTVTVIDRSGLAEETSKGNAAALAFSDIMPLASPKILLRAPKWLLDPLGPLTIRPSYLPRLTPWLWQFWKASLPSRYRASIETQTALMRLAETEMMALVDRAGIAGMVRHDGSLELYESEAELNAASAGWRQREQAGIAFEHVRGQRLVELQPGLSPASSPAPSCPAGRPCLNRKPLPWRSGPMRNAAGQPSRKPRLPVWSGPKQAPLSGLPTAPHAAPTASSSAPAPGRRA